MNKFVCFFFLKRLNLNFLAMNSYNVITLLNFSSEHHENLHTHNQKYRINTETETVLFPRDEK